MQTFAQGAQHKLRRTDRYACRRGWESQDWGGCEMLGFSLQLVSLHVWGNDGWRTRNLDQQTVICVTRVVPA